MSIPKALHEYTERWVSKPGMTAKVAPQNGLEFLLYRNGKLCGSVWIEHMSPPTKPDPGDTRAVQPPKEPA
ncbi:MAG TPA: hypothetical protein VI229_00210 [Burkholderiales bacterium]